MLIKKDIWTRSKATFLLLALVGFNSAKAQNSGEISKSFADYLAGKTLVVPVQKKLKTKEVKASQQMVWQAWVDANHRLSEDKLPALAPLSEKNIGKWPLPQQLEPNAIMPFYWGSKGDMPEGGFPFFLYIHGSGHKDNEWATGIRICQNFEDAPSAYFIPQIPQMENYYRWWQKSKQYAWEKLLRQLMVSETINPNKIYFFGISEGGYGSQRLASFYADYLAGAGPMAGGEPLINAPAENYSNIAFSFLTGDQDHMFERHLLTQETKNELERMQAKHPDYYNHRIELIPGKGHSIDYSPTTPWLKQFTRNPYPKYIHWENFPMDGLYRDAFYNLVVNERSNANEDTRTTYEMSIEGNVIDMHVDLVSYKGIKFSERWGFPVRYEKSYEMAKTGKFTIYLNEKLVDLKKEIVVRVNGKEAFRGKLKPELSHMINSCALFYDSQRIFPSAVTIDISQL
ncbi:MAG: hypothetical protein ACRC9Q_05165 [Bacteroidales bacterium]